MQVLKKKMFIAHAHTHTHFAFEIYSLMQFQTNVLYSCIFNAANKQTIFMSVESYNILLDVM